MTTTVEVRPGKITYVTSNDDMSIDSEVYNSCTAVYLAKNGDSSEAVASAVSHYPDDISIKLRAIAWRMKQEAAQHPGFGSAESKKIHVFYHPRNFEDAIRRYFNPSFAGVDIEYHGTPTIAKIAFDIKNETFMIDLTVL